MRTMRFNASATHYFEHEDVEHTLRLSFVIEEWEESRPYGDTIAWEAMSDVVEDSYKYELDGEELSQGQLFDRFGTDLIQPILDQMEKDAKKESKPIDSGSDFDEDEE